jgi:hypothetical protein
MRRQVIWVVALLALLPAAGARGSPDDKDKQKAATPAERYQAIVKEYQKAQQDFSKHYQSAKTDDERQKAFEEYYPKPQKYTGRLLQLAEDNVKDPVAVDAAMWVVINGRGSPDADKATQLLLKEHLSSPKLGQLAKMLSYSGSSGEKPLQEILEKCPVKEVQGQAAFYLGKLYRNQVSRGQAGQGAGDLTAKARQAFERVAKDYADVQVEGSTLGAMVKTQFAAIKALETRDKANLEVGKIAPEIEGEDVDGKAFKLSDYRGKVVVLDFWGHW